MPTFFIDLILFKRKYRYLHSLSIQAFSFDHVHDINGYLFGYFIFGSKEEPLIISMGVGIIF
jgi:hypothetical protein